MRNLVAGAVLALGIAGSAGLPAQELSAEDASLAPEGEIAAPAYTTELLGDSTMITVRAGGALAAVKAHKEVRAQIGERVAIRVPPAICHLFDARTGQRLETRA